MHFFFFYVLDNTLYNNNKILSAIIVIETLSHTHKKKLIKLFRNSNIEIKVEIVTDLLGPIFYKDKTN